MKEKIKNYIMMNMDDFDQVDFSYEDNIFQKGFVNSMFAMKLLNYIEKEFDIQVGDDDIQIKNFSTVNNIAHLIEKQSKKTA